jgi:hypothetical protein
MLRQQSQGTAEVLSRLIEVFCIASVIKAREELNSKINQ